MLALTPPATPSPPLPRKRGREQVQSASPLALTFGAAKKQNETEN